MFRTMRPALRVAVLAGGESAERSVSLASGRSVAEALSQAGHVVSCLDPREELDLARSGRLNAARSAGGPEFRPARLADVDWAQFDLCFLALHGGAGEDGRVQQFLTERGVLFTGPSSQSARVAMSKRASKERFRAAAVPTPDYETFWSETGERELGQLADRLGYPLIAKPDGQGSSLGVEFVSSSAELATAVGQCLRFDRCGLLERYVAGREFSVAVLDREAYPPVEVSCREPIFSFQAKYDPVAGQRRPAGGLSKARALELTRLAIQTAEALETAGLVRVDLRLDTDGRPWVLELNAIPGMTPTSLAPAAARSAGIDLPTLCDELVRRSVERGAKL